MPRVADAIVRAREPTVLDLTLARPATLHGMVWDPDAEAALEGVDVQLLSTDGALASSCATDAEGRYRFEGLRPATYSIVVDCPTGYVTAEARRTVSLTPKQVLEVDFELRPGGVVRGRVVDEHTGEPLPDVDVILTDPQGRFVRRARTTNAGEYEFLNLPEDRYQVSVADDDVGSG